MWRTDDLVEAAAAALEREERRRRRDQAVYGLDSLDEVGLHDLLVAGLRRAGFGVHRERPYPSRRQRELEAAAVEAGAEAAGDIPPAPLPPLSARERCDLVLTPEPGATLADPLRRVKPPRPARRKKQVEATLFERAVAGEAPAPCAPPPPQAAGHAPHAVPPEDAFWLEVKLVGQYCFNCGVPGPNRTYASELIRAAALDLSKLGRDRLIVHSALLLVLFTADEATAEHDLVQLMHRCLDRGLPGSSPITRRFGVTDRIGNTVCSVSVIAPRRA